MKALNNHSKSLLNYLNYSNACALGGKRVPLATSVNAKFSNESSLDSLSIQEDSSKVLISEDSHCNACEEDSTQFQKIDFKDAIFDFLDSDDLSTTTSGFSLQIARSA